MSKNVILNSVIIGYRRSIDNRYQYKKLAKTYALPESVNEAIVSDIKHYFLEYVYPTVEKRQELNEAFAALDDFIKNPKKLLGLLRQSFKIVFNYGKQFPQILNAGLKALKSFRTATKFENNLVAAAIANKAQPPYSDAQINNFISQLSKENIEAFINSTQTLFEIIYDETLVNNIKDMLKFLIKLMQDKPKVYSRQDIKAIEIGLEMIVQAQALFNKLTPKNQKQLIAIITKIERDNIKALFSK